MHIKGTSGKHTLKLAIALALASGMGSSQLAVAASGDICQSDGGNDCEDITGTLFTDGYDIDTESGDVLLDGGDLDTEGGDINAEDITAESFDDGDGTHIEDGTVTTNNLVTGEGTINGFEILDETVDTEDLHDDAVTNAKLADNAVDTLQIVNDAVTNEKIADNAVDTLQIADGAVDTLQLDDGAVETSKIDDLAVTTAKIDDDAVTTAKIDDLAVTTAKIADSAVTTIKIADDAVTGDKIDDGTITAADLGTITSISGGTATFDTFEGGDFNGDTLDIMDGDTSLVVDGSTIAASVTDAAESSELDMSSTGASLTVTDGANTKGLTITNSGSEIHTLLNGGTGTAYVDLVDAETLIRNTTGKVTVKADVGNVDVVAGDDFTVTATDAVTISGSTGAASVSGATASLSSTSGAASMTGAVGASVTATDGVASILGDDGVSVTATAGPASLTASNGAATVTATGGDATLESTDQAVIVKGQTAATVTATTGPADLEALAGAASVTATGGDATLESTDQAAIVLGQAGASVTATTGDVDIEATAGEVDIDAGTTVDIDAVGAATMTGDTVMLDATAGLPGEGGIMSLTGTNASLTLVGPTGTTPHGLIVSDQVTTLTGGMSSPSLTLADPDAVLTNDTGHVTLSTTGVGDKDIRLMSTDDVFIDATDIVDITGTTSASLNTGVGPGTSSFDATAASAKMSHASGSEVSALSNGTVTANSSNTVGNLTVGNGASSMTGGDLVSPGTPTTLTLNNSGAHLDNHLDMGFNQINNLMDGTSKYDAVNKGQLDDVEDLAKSGIAAVAAMAAVPGPIPGKRYSIGVGAGFFKSESAVALGFNAQVTDSIMVTASAGVSDNETAGGVGASFSW